MKYISMLLSIGIFYVINQGVYVDQPFRNPLLFVLMLFALVLGAVGATESHKPSHVIGFYGVVFTIFNFFYFLIVEFIDFERNPLLERVKQIIAQLNSDFMLLILVIGVAVMFVRLLDGKKPDFDDIP